MYKLKYSRFVTRTLSGCAIAALAVYAVPAIATSFADPLINAADDGRLQTVSDMVAQGASPETRGRFGVTPLMRSAYGGHNKVSALLISKGADINAEDVGGETALHMAARAGRDDTVALLLSSGADVTKKDHEGWTPLMRAVNAGSTDTVRALLDAGADPAMKNGFSETSYHLAAESRDRGVLATVFSGASLESLKRDAPLRDAVLKQAKGGNAGLISGALNGKGIGGGAFASVFAPVKRTASLLVSKSENTFSGFFETPSRAPVIVVKDAPTQQANAPAAVASSEIISSKPVYSEGDPLPGASVAKKTQTYTAPAVVKAGVVTDTPPVNNGRSAGGLPVPMLKASSAAALRGTVNAAAPAPSYTAPAESALPLWVQAFSDTIFNRDGERPGRAERAPEPAVEVAQYEAPQPEAAPRKSRGFFSLPFFSKSDDTPTQVAALAENVYYVQFGTYADQRVAIGQWEQMRASMPIMNEFYPKVVPVYLAAPDSLRYRLRAGVFGYEGDANAVCTYFYDQGVDCLVVESSGDEQAASFLENMAPIEDILRRAGADLPDKPASSKRRTSSASVVASADERTITGLPWLKKKSTPKGIKERDLDIMPTPQFKPDVTVYAGAPASGDSQAEDNFFTAVLKAKPKVAPAVKKPTPKPVVVAAVPPKPVPVAAPVPAQAEPAPVKMAKLTTMSGDGSSQFPFIAPSFNTPAPAKSKKPVPVVVKTKPVEIASATPVPSVSSAPAAGEDTGAYMRNYLEYRRKKEGDAAKNPAATPRVGLSEAVYVPKELAAELKKTPKALPSVSAAQEKLRNDMYRVTVTGFKDRADADGFKRSLSTRKLVGGQAVVNYGSSLSGREELRLSPLDAGVADKVCKASYAYGYVCSYVPLLD